MFRTRSRESREEGRRIDGPRTRMFGRGRGRDIDLPGPRSSGTGDWIIGLAIHGSLRGDSGGCSACLPGFLKGLRCLGAEKVLDHVIWLFVNETKVLFNMTRPLELFVTQWALVLASLRGFLEMASQGRELGEGLPAGAHVGLVLVLGGMLLQLIVVWERSGASGACVRQVGLDTRVPRRASYVSILVTIGRALGVGQLSVTIDGYATAERLKKKRMGFTYPVDPALACKDTDSTMGGKVALLVTDCPAPVRAGGFSTPDWSVVGRKGASSGSKAGWALY